MIILRYIILSVFTLLPLVGCKKKLSDKIMLVPKEKVLELIDTITIEIDSELLGTYLSWSISENNDLIAYNHLLHKIDVFSLSGQKFLYSIKLDKQGPHEVNPLSNVVKIQDGFFASSGSFYYIISPEGEVLDKKRFAELSISKKSYHASQKGPQMVGFDYFSLTQGRDGFFQPIYKYKEDGSIDFSSYFMCLINFRDWNSTPIQVSYPSLFVELYSKSFTLGSANMIQSGPSLVFNFPCANEIFELDTLTMYLKTHSPDILNKNEMKIDISKYGSDIYSQAYAQMLSPRYLPVKYDRKNKSYFRLHKTKAKGRNMFSASFFLIKMDSNFNTLEQYELDRYFNPVFQVHDGYIFFTGSKVDESALYVLKIYRLEV